jgi:hypothetical protein
METGLLIMETGQLYRGNLNKALRPFAKWVLVYHYVECSV